MLSTSEILFFATLLVVILLPAFYTSISRSSVPESSWFAKYYRAERYLNLADNLFLLTLCAYFIAMLGLHFGLHFGFIDASVSDGLRQPIDWALIVTAVAKVALWIRAALKVHRSSGTNA